MIKKIYNKSFENTFYILAYITNKCNYACWYCYDRKNRGNNELDLNQLYLFILKIRQQTTKKIDLNLIGGEPTVHKDIINFIKRVTAINNLTVTIMTNLSQNIEFYNTLNTINNCYLTASLHTLHNKVNYDFIHKSRKLTNIRDIIVLYNSQDTKNSIQAYNELLSLGFKNVELDLLNYHKYTQEQIVLFNNTKKNSQMYSILNDNNETTESFDNLFYDVSKITFSRWLCYAGVMSIYINYNGDIYNCESYKDNNYKPIGNIQLPFNIPTKPILCKCGKCAGDFYIKKENIFKKNANTSNKE